MNKKTEKLHELIIQSVHLESQGWKVTWKHNCELCGKPNSFPKYATFVECGYCKKEFVMVDPKLLQSKV